MKDNVDNFPVVTLSKDALPEPLIETITALSVATTYTGYAPLGTKTSEAKWFIKRTIVDSSVVGTVTTKTEYPNGKMSYDSVWDDRAALKYTR